MTEGVYFAYASLCGAIIDQAHKDIEKDLKNKMSGKKYKCFKEDARWARDAKVFLQSEWCQNLEGHYSFAARVLNDRNAPRNCRSSY